jgi:ABC-type polysaccharide/polyol phosphate export permease
MFFEIFFEKVKKYLPIFPFINCKVGNSRLFLKEGVVVYNIIVFLQVDSFKTAGAILSLILLLITFMLSTTLFTYVFAFVFSNYETCQSAMTTLYFFVSYKLYSYIIVDETLCGGCCHV